MNDFATTHRRWGYKRAWARAKSEGIIVGRDTFRRLWRSEGLRVRPWLGLVLWAGCFEGCWLLLVVLCPLARVLVG